MGTTCDFVNLNSKEKLQAYLRNLSEGEYKHKKTTVVYQSIVGNVCYQAVKFENLETKEEYVTAYITKFTRSFDEFCYKSFNEAEGPYYYDAPNVLLSKLTATEDKLALEWRETVRKSNEKKKIKLQEGDKVTFDEAIVFSDGNSYKSFIVTKYNKRFVFRSVKDGSLCRIRNWRNLNFKIDKANVEGSN